MLRFFRGSLSRLKFALPELGYPIEQGIPPSITPTQLDLHFNKHHKAYVDKLNELTEGTPLADHPIEHVIHHAWLNRPSTQVLFNQAAQHYNHSFYWACMRPGGTPDVPPKLMMHIEKDFGTFDEFKKAFAASALANFGSGWTWLVWNAHTKKLALVNTGNAEVPITTAGYAPLLTCDVWEHAYYVDYQNRRAEYLQKFWNIVDWYSVSARLEEIDLHPAPAK